VAQFGSFAAAPSPSLSTDLHLPSDWRPFGASLGPFGKPVGKDPLRRLARQLDSPSLAERRTSGLMLAQKLGAKKWAGSARGPRRQATHLAISIVFRDCLEG